MFGLLSWLWEQASKVYHWFGVQFWVFVSVISNIGSNIYTWAVWAYNNAVNYAIQYVQTVAYNLKTGFNTVVDWVRARAIDAFNLAIQAYNAISTIWTQVTGYISVTLQQVYNTVRTWIEERIRQLHGVVEAGKGWLVVYINNLVAPWVVLAERVKTLVSYFTPSRLDDLSRLLQDKKQTLVTFLDNPAGFLIGLLVDKLLEILSYEIAYALGTVKYDLEPKPSYAFTGYVPGEAVSIPGRRVSGGLSLPLDTIRVSGYPFRPGHPGLDLGLTRGQTVYTMHAGEVTAAGWSNAGYGFYVDVSGDGIWSRYAHLEKPVVTVGESVLAGAVIGLGNSTGNSTGDHLHLEIKINGVYVDPVQLLEQAR